jgi:hypothetical protein
MERGGLTSRADFKRFDRISELMSQGQPAEARAVLKSINWGPMGLTGEEILRWFPWALLPVAATVARGALDPASATVPLASPWWTGGYESKKRSVARMEQVCVCA